MTVSTNGMFTIGNRTVGYNPRGFPINKENSVVIAPFWADFDISNTSDPSVYYTIYENMKADTNLTQTWRSSLDNSFTPTWGIEVVWSLVPPYPSQDYDKKQNVTFKAILLTDGGRTYLIFDYMSSNLRYNEARRPFIGWDIDNGTNVFVHPKSGNASAIDIFNENGNAGTGKYVFPLFDSGMTVSHTNICREWIKSELLSPPIQAIPSCPCTYGQAVSDLRFKMNGNCANFVHPNGNGYGLQCCYDSSNSEAKDSLLTSPRGPSAFYRYHPSNSKHQEELLAAENCCHHDDLCNQYYNYRPVPSCNCTNGPPPGLATATALGTPHIRTFDGLDYTFSGAGEFTMMEVTNGIQMQGRMQYLWINDDRSLENQNTTVFTAFALQESGSSNTTIQLNEKRDGLQIYVDGTEITNGFNGNTAYEQIFTGLTLYRDNNCAVVVFTSEFAAKFCPVKSTLEVSVMSPEGVISGNRGLFGRANNQFTDDLTLPDNTVLPDNETEKAIFEGMKQWNISAETSIFTYPPGLSYNNFSKVNFVPKFLKDNFPGQGSSAEAICKNSDKRTNSKCQYDIVIGQDEARANRTVEQDILFDDTVYVLSKHVPCVQGAVIFNVTVNETFTTYVDRPDPTVNVSCILPSGASCTDVNDTLVEVVWTPASLTDARLSFVATDTEGSKSQSHDTLINICDCNGNGVCRFDRIIPDQNPRSNFRIVTCDCELGWTGSHCQFDFNGCEGAPCVARNTGCTDLTPAVQRQRKYPYECTSCPTTGYEQVGPKCIDTNECQQNDTICGPFSTCINTDGSYRCECQQGYISVNGICQLVTTTSTTTVPTTTPLAQVRKHVELEIALPGEFTSSSIPEIQSSLLVLFQNISALKSIDIPLNALVYDNTTNTTKVNFNVTLDKPVEPKDEEQIANAMSAASGSTTDRIVLNIGNYSVPVIQTSPYIYVQLPNGTEAKVPLFNITDKCTIYTQSGACRNGGACILDAAGEPQCSCADGFTGDYCQYERVQATTEAVDPLTVIVPVGGALGALLLLSCLILALRRSDKGKPDELETDGDGLPVFPGIPSTTFMPRYDRSNWRQFSNAPSTWSESSGPFVSLPYPYPYPYDDEELNQSPGSDIESDDISINSTVSDLPSPWYYDPLMSEPQFEIARPLVDPEANPNF